MNSASTKPQSDDSFDQEIVRELTQAQPRLLLFIRSLMPGETEADEILQQTNAKIWENRRRYESGSNFLAWAIAITKFETLNHIKRQQRDSKLTFSDRLENLIADDAMHLNDDIAEKRQALKYCLAELSSEHRNLLLSRYSGNNELAEVAKQLRRSPAGIRVTLTRLRTKILECIQRRLANSMREANT